MSVNMGPGATEAGLQTRVARVLAWLAAGLLLAGPSGCGQLAEITHTHPLRATAPDPGSLHPTRMFARHRVVAIGDLHGDVRAARAALRLAGAMDEHGHWCGGDMILVQVGDVLDRGEDERELLDLLEGLEKQARAVGGRLVQLNGNHEVMNVLGDFRYTSAAGLNDFDPTPGLDLAAPLPGEVGGLAGARAEAFRPGGTWAQRLARFPIAVVVGDTVFVHAGLEPQMVELGLERINREARLWMWGSGPFPKYLDDRDSPVWTRLFDRDDPVACARLKVSLAALGARRMVVGHNPHIEGIRSGCGEAVWRIDTGMSRFFGGHPEVLSIEGDSVKVRSARAPVPGQVAPAAPEPRSP